VHSFIGAKLYKSSSSLWVAYCLLRNLDRFLNSEHTSNCRYESRS